MMHDLVKLAMAMLALSVVVGCTISARTGTDFDPSTVGSMLKPGIASQADVRAALGEPFAKNSAMMPFHNRPHLTWTYFTERAAVGAGSGKMEDQMKYLFVFFDGDRMDSYLWFTSTVQ
jgi:hypothetical protein